MNQDRLSPLEGLFHALGQTLLLLDGEFRILRAAGLSNWPTLGEMAEMGERPGLRGRAVAEVLRAGLFGPGQWLRQALEVGRRRNAWRSSVWLEGQDPCLVEISAAPLEAATGEQLGEPSARYAVLLHPEQEAVKPDAASVPVSFGGLVTRSPAMVEIFRCIDNLRGSEATVLVTGESGTGKELVARALHQRSRRAQGPFVALSCGAFPDTLLESELFGHARGAFTGAVKERVGRFEAAQDGTLFLDEIGDMPLPLQVKLLRVLQERSLERLGETRPRSVNARFVAATHVDLKQAMAQGRFRQDLYYRLRVVTLHLPPLRQRPEDIEPLVEHFLTRAMARDRRPYRLSPPALEALLLHDWPGNIRELENALEHTVSMADSGALGLADLPPELRERTVGFPEDGCPPPGGEPTGEDILEPERIREALETHRWRRGPTAAALGISRTTLWRQMRRLGWAR